jgi:hypothetical protein
MRGVSTTIIYNSMKEEFNKIYNSCESGEIQVLKELLISIEKEKIHMHVKKVPLFYYNISNNSLKM